MGAIYVTVCVFFSCSFPKTGTLQGPLYIIYIFLGLCRDTLFSTEAAKNRVHHALSIQQRLNLNLEEL